MEVKELSKIEPHYYSWLCYLVMNGAPSYTINLRNKNTIYSKLLRLLYDTPFNYLIERDGNRESDGIDLRYRFGNEYNYDVREVAIYLDDRPCSILEMMVALCVRCEEQMMSDMDVDKPGKWFWYMIESLGLLGMDDRNFNKLYCEYVIKKFLNRDYYPNGKGGLFYIPSIDVDLRTKEIWFQLCRYLEYASS